MEGASVSVLELGLSGTTGADGVYDFGEVAAGTYTVSGQKDTFSPSGGSPSSPTSQSLPAPAGTSTQFELVLDPGARISVHVQQTDGTPVQGATVSVDGKGWSGVTDASGNFDFGAVPSDTYTITAQKNCCTPSPASQTQTASPGTSTQYQLVLNAVKISSLTVATSPADRARLRIGVGEEVDLTITPGPATWAITSGSGTLTPNSGSQSTVKFTASDKAESVTITATYSGAPCSITFTIVEPTDWTQKRTSNIFHSAGRPNCGWKGEFYIHPNDVNFYRLNFREKDSQAVATGSFAIFNGVWHGTYPLPDRASDWLAIVGHTDADGSKVGGIDTVYSGDPTAANTGAAPPFIVGTMYFPITMQWKVGIGSPKNFATTRQEHEIFANGKCESRKGGNSEQRMYNDPPSGY